MKKTTKLIILIILIQIFFLTNIRFSFAYRNQDVLASSSIFKGFSNIEDLIKTLKIRYVQAHGIIKTVTSMNEYNKLQNQGYSLASNGYLERGLKGGEDSFKGEKLLSFQAHKGEITHIKALSSELLLTSGTDKKLKIWNLKRGICQKEIEYGEILIINMLKLKDNTIVTTHGNGEIKFWDILNGEISITKNISPDKKITSLAEMTNGELAIGLENGQIKITNRFLIEKKGIEAHKASVNALVGTADGRLASAGEYGKIKIWGKGYSLEKQYTQSNSFAVQDLIELETGDRKLLSLGKDGTIQLWRIKKDEKSKGLVKADFKVEQAQNFIELLDKNPRTIAVSTQSGEIKIYDRKKGRLIHNYKQDKGMINVLERISEGITASGTDRGIITILDFGYSNKKRYRSKNIDITKNIKVELEQEKQEEKKEIKIQAVQTQESEEPEIITKEQQIQEEAKEEQIQEEKQIELPVIQKIEITEEEKKDLSQKLEHFKQKRLTKYKELESYNQNLYIPLQASNIPYSESTFDLEEKIKEFIEDKDLKELILFAQGGSGKTLFSKRLEYDLWSKFKSENDIIPLYISLPSLGNYKETAIEETLENHGFTEKQIEILKQNNEFLFILDGYDELLDYPNLYEENELNEWNAKTIITCRQEYFLKFRNGHSGYLYPLKENGVPEYNKAQEIYISSFSESQRKTYIEKYIQQSQTHWQVKDYEDHITSNPALEELAKTPFTLKLIVEVLPGLIEKQNQDKDFKIGINAVYDAFIENWFLREIEKLETKEKTKLTKDQKEQKYTIFKNYCQRLASVMHKKGLTEVEYKKTKKQQNEWTEFFDSSDEEVKFCQRACPIIKSEQENKWRFLHKTLQEYFVTKQTLNLIEHELEKKETEKKQEQSEKAFKRIVEGMNSQLEEPSIIRFRVDSIKENPAYKDILFKIIELSKTDETVSTAAANAITALNAAGETFIGMNLAGIKIPGADLSGSNFSKANLQGADLRRVRFEKSILTLTDLRLSKMEEVEFAERAYLEVGSPIWSMAYSPDGKILAVGSSDGNIRLWDTKSGKHIYTFTGHTDQVSSLAYNTDGSILASGSWDTTVRLWDVKNSKHLYTFTGHTKKVNSVAYSTDGSMLASGSWDTTVRLWDVKNFKHHSTINGDPGTIISVIYNPDGKTLATGGFVSGIKLWDTVNYEQVSYIGGHIKFEKSMTYSPDGKTIATAGNFNNFLDFIDVKTGYRISNDSDFAHGHAGDMIIVAYNPEGTTLATADIDNIISLWDVETGKHLFSITGHKGWVRSIEYSLDGTILAIGCLDGTVRLLDTKIGKLLSNFSKYIKGVSCSVHSPDGEIFVMGNLSGNLMFWNARTGKYLYTIKGFQYNMKRLKYSPDGRTIVTATSNSVILGDARTGKHIFKLSGDIGFIRFQYSPDGTTMTTVNRPENNQDGVVRLWNTKTGECLFCIAGDEVIYNSDGTVIATVSDDKTVMLWDVKTGNHLYTLKGHKQKIKSLKYSVDGTIFAIIGDNKTVSLWDLKIVKFLCTIKGHKKKINSVTYSPDGTVIATASDDQIVILWDVKTGKRLCTLKGHTDDIRSVVYSPDGTVIATASDDQTVMFWEVKTGKQLYIIKEHTRKVKSVVYRPDGAIVATGSDDQTVMLWDAKTWRHLSTLEHSGFIENIKYSSDGTSLGIVSSDKSLKVWDLKPLSQGLEATLIFNIASSPALFLEGAMIDGVRGLSVGNYNLLKQRGAKGESTNPANLTPFPSQAQEKEKLNFKISENIPQEINITIDPTQTSIACNTWNNQTNKCEISLSQAFVKFIKNSVNEGQYYDILDVILKTELTQINQRKLTGKKYSIETNEEEFKDFEINTLLYSWINISKEKLLNYQTALDSYWQYLIDQNYKNKKIHQQGVESYLAILDYVINNHETLGSVIDNSDVLLTVEAIRGSKIEMINDDQIGNIKILAAA